MCRLTLLSLATVMMLTVPGSLRAADDELAAGPFRHSKALSAR